MIPLRKTDNALNIDILHEKLSDAEIPGFYAMFSPEEAEAIGAFDEDALSDEDAYLASFDNPDL